MLGSAVTFYGIWQLQDAMMRGEFRLQFHSRIDGVNVVYQLTGEEYKDDPRNPYRKGGAVAH